MDYFALLIVFLIGILSKFADLVADEGLKVKKSLAYITGMVYGVLIAYVLVNYPLLAPLGLAIVLAVLLTKKIDRKPHNVGIASMFLFLGILGFPRVDVVLLAVFLIAGGLDEVGNDLADRGRIKGIAGRFFEFRMTLEITAFLVSLLTGNCIIFLGMLGYDLGYVLTKKAGKKFI
jgi:hypothetical protein